MNILRNTYASSRSRNNRLCLSSHCSQNYFTDFWTFGFEQFYVACVQNTRDVLKFDNRLIKACTERRNSVLQEKNVKTNQKTQNMQTNNHDVKYSWKFMARNSLKEFWLFLKFYESISKSSLDYLDLKVVLYHPKSKNFFDIQDRNTNYNPEINLSKTSSPTKSI